MKSHSPFLADELSKPNNLLGFRYTETILRNHFPMEIDVVHRDMNHNISASEARKDLLLQSSGSLLPSRSAGEAESLIKSGHFSDFSRFEDACLLHARLLSEKSFQKPAFLQRDWTIMV